MAIFDTKIQDVEQPADIGPVHTGQATTVVDKSTAAWIDLATGVAETGGKAFVKEGATRVAKEEMDAFTIGAAAKEDSATEEAASGKKDILGGEAPAVIQAEIDAEKRGIDRDAEYKKQTGNSSMSLLNASVRVKRAAAVMPGWSDEVSAYVTDKLGVDVGGKLFQMAMAHEEAGIKKEATLSNLALEMGIPEWQGTDAQYDELQTRLKERYDTGATGARLDNLLKNQQLIKSQVETGILTGEQGKAATLALDTASFHQSAAEVREGIYHQEREFYKWAKDNVDAEGFPKDPAAFDARLQQALAYTTAATQGLSTMRGNAARQTIDGKIVNQSLNSVDSYVVKLEERLNGMTSAERGSKAIKLNEIEAMLSLHRDNPTQAALLTAVTKAGGGRGVLAQSLESQISQNMLQQKAARIAAAKGDPVKLEQIERDNKEADANLLKPFNPGGERITPISIGNHLSTVQAYNKHPSEDSGFTARMHEVTMKQLITFDSEVLGSKKHQDLVSTLHGDTPAAKSFQAWVTQPGMEKYKADYDLMLDRRAGQVTRALAKVGSEGKVNTFNTSGRTDIYTIGKDGVVGAGRAGSLNSGYNGTSAYYAGKYSTVMNEHTALGSIFTAPEKREGVRRQESFNLAKSTGGLGITRLDGQDYPLQFHVSQNAHLPKNVVKGEVQPYNLIGDTLYLYDAADGMMTAHAIDVPKTFSGMLSAAGLPADVDLSGLKNGEVVPFGGVNWTYDEKAGDLVR